MPVPFPKADRRHLLPAVPLVVTAAAGVVLTGLSTACAVQWLRTMSLERKVLRRALKAPPPPPTPEEE